MSDKTKEFELAQNLMDQGEYKEALQIIDNLEENSELNNEEKISCYLLKGTVLSHLNRFEESYRLADQAYQESKEAGNTLYKIDALILMARCLSRFGKYDDTVNILLQAEDLLKNFPTLSKIELIQRKAQIFLIRGWIYFYKGESKNALSNAKKSLTLYDDIDDKKSKLSSFVLLGHIYTLYKGDLEKGLNFSERANELGEEIGIQKCIFFYALNLTNIGNIYSKKGEFDHALPYYEQSLELFKKIDDKLLINTTLSNIGNLFWFKGELSQALKYFEKIYINYKAIGNPWFISGTLATLFELSLDNNDVESANRYFKKLQKLDKEEENLFIKALHRYCQAKLFRNSSRIRDQVKAQNIFKQIVEDKIHDALMINALVELCDLLLIELQSTNNTDVLNELNSYILQLLDYAESQNSYRILGEAYLLQARLTLVSFDFKTARQLFSQAQKVAEKYGNKYLAMKISNEHDELIKNLEIWENIKERNASMTDRLKLARLDKEMDILVKKELEHPKMKVEQPILLIIISNNGKIILSKFFITEMSIDDTYVGKFLTVFNVFTNQIFSESFDRVKFGQYTVLFTQINSFFIVYMFQGQTYGARQKLIHFSDTIKKDSQIKQNLERSYNEGTIFELKTDPLLEELIINSFLSHPQKFQVPFKAYAGKKRFVFVSYSHADKLQVYPIIEFLNKNGIRIWYDEGIPISENWKKSIVDNLERCNVFLVFISPHIINSEMVRKEISFALKNKKRFFAVYLKETELSSELAFEIADIQALMKYKLSENEFSKKLKDSLTQCLEDQG